MKNFSELLATDLYLEVAVNNQIRRVGLHDALVFDLGDTVVIDSIEILPKYSYLGSNGVLTINTPFYQWLHHVTAQGWLLTPY
jgi:hypothetical protein